jgi:hypothetical protein
MDLPYEGWPDVPSQFASTSDNKHVSFAICVTVLRQEFYRERASLSVEQRRAIRSVKTPRPLLAGPQLVQLVVEFNAVDILRPIE